MTGITTLARWLKIQPEQVVSIEQDQSKLTKDLLIEVQRWMQALTDQPGKRWAVYHDDAFEFMAITFALWQLGKTVCVPGDNRSGTISRLAGYVDGFLGQFHEPTVTRKPSSIREEFHENWIELKENFHALEIYTSGSTGEPKPISKTIAQIDTEIASIERLWPSHEKSVVLTTVSHQHLYGLTFRLFWPLCTGRSFSQNLCEYPEEILQQAQQQNSFSLITSPSHLGRINPSLGWPLVAGKCDYVISSAAPLRREDSLIVQQLLKAPVREIYGSSETGAIAWRTQLLDEKDALWKPLSGVELSQTTEGTLRVQAPYLETKAPFVLADQILFFEDGFKLLGRKDRIVKVEGKRVSLVAIEKKLIEKTQLVKAARVITLERKRVETAVVLQLTKVGQQELSSGGRKKIISILKAELAEFFEAVVLPRRWRFVDEMPFNAQGKLPLDGLLSLFEKEPVIWPTINSMTEEGQKIHLACYIPANLEYFDGHFSTRAILPGIVQVHWAEAYGREHLSIEGRFLRLEVIKFQQVIPPDSVVSIEIKYDRKTMKLTFKYESDRGVHSSGRICFGK